MKIIVCVCVHDRFDNIQTWVNCWRESNTKNAELRIIHNYYGDDTLRKKFQDYSKENKITYIPVDAPGFDIGRFQDVCRERLKGFSNNWDLLLWCCDDTIPMRKDFLSPYLDQLTEDVGVVCTDLSPYVRPHIRTTGFLIRKETTLKLTFEVDPITTKEHCYRFEHRDSLNWFYIQVIRMGLKVIQVGPRETSPLWDKGYLRGLKRLSEHYKVFPVKRKVVFICPIFDAFPEIISSLICQTHKDWELLLIDDNPEETICRAVVEAVKDKRIKYIKRPRLEKWGHPHRQWALNEIKEGRLASDSDFLIITNGDNYYLPPFIERMLEGFSNGAVATYCSSMLHSYIKWGIIQCRFQRGFIDCGGVMIKKDVAIDVGWNDTESHSADWSYFSDIATKYGAKNFVSVRGTLFIHN